MNINNGSGIIVKILEYNFRAENKIKEFMIIFNIINNKPTFFDTLIFEKKLAWCFSCLAWILAIPGVKAMIWSDMSIHLSVQRRIGTYFWEPMFLFGMIQAGRIIISIAKGWDWCSGYHHSGKSPYSIFTLHFSGTGIGDWGDIALLPANGTIYDWASKPGWLVRRLWLAFDHDNEVCSPGYYKGLSGSI